MFNDILLCHACNKTELLVFGSSCAKRPFYVFSPRSDVWLWLFRMTPGCMYNSVVGQRTFNNRLWPLVFFNLGRNESLDTRVLSMSWPRGFANITTGPASLFWLQQRAWAISQWKRKHRQAQRGRTTFPSCCHRRVYVALPELRLGLPQGARQCAPILLMTVYLTACGGYLIAAPILCKYLTDSDHRRDVWDLSTLSDPGTASGTDQIRSINAH